MKILLLFTLMLCSIFAFSSTKRIINYNATEYDDYLLIMVHDGTWAGSDWHSLTVQGKDLAFTVSGKIVDNKYQIESGTNLIDIWDLQFVRMYTALNIGGIDNNDSMVLELRDSITAEALGFVYITPPTNTSVYLSQGAVDTFQMIKDKVDSVWVEEGFTIGSGDTLEITTSTKGTGGGVSYVVAFQQPDPYESGYTLAELDYEYVYNNSATDYLKKILDTDRNNELVGFRYYSDKNSQEYTVFIKANN